MSDIRRMGIYSGELEDCPTGSLMLYDDHVAALTELREKLAVTRELYEQSQRIVEAEKQAHRSTERILLAAWEADKAKILADFDAADKERLKETHDSHAEAAKWQAEGDWYGYNFHEGKAAGTVQASLAYERVRRNLRAALKSTGTG